MNLKYFFGTALFASIALTMNAKRQKVKRDFIGKFTSQLKSTVMTPEILWKMGRVGNFVISPNQKIGVYSVTYYSKEKNTAHTVLYSVNMENKRTILLTHSNDNESSPYIMKNGKQIVYISNKTGKRELFIMNIDGTKKKQITFEREGVDDYTFSPNEEYVILIKNIPMHHSIQSNPKDLPLATGMVINDLMYKHWDHYVTSVPHPFLARFKKDTVNILYDILEGQPYECPMEPFGGIEQIAWSPNSQEIAYTCRKKIGLKYAISTDSDIYLFKIKEKKTINLCKSLNYKEPSVDALRSFENQSINKSEEDNNVGYDINPQFSPDGKYIAWSSMARAGYESDRARLCVYNFSNKKKIYITDKFQSSINDFVWGKNSKDLYFTGVWHGTTEIYKTDFAGNIEKLTNNIADYHILSLTPNGEDLLVKRHSMSHPDDAYLFNIKSRTLTNLTYENDHILAQIKLGKVIERWVKTVDGKKEQCWVIYPPFFNPNKKYPTLLYCEGGPQSPVSQFWSYRWNFQMMAANGYIIIAPNRRGLPGYGMAWLEEISGDYPGLCMKDYLSAIDDISKESYVDKEHLGAIGASFGGYSVYWLAGHNNGRFKALIAHDGIFNTQQQYLETEEMWFPNWDLKSAPWIKEHNQIQKAYKGSPHLFVDKWTAPILCIHGQHDYRIEYTQAESAFAAAKLRGIPAQLLLFPDEGHWVLKPQNGILWQRVFANWLDRWLKPRKK